MARNYSVPGNCTNTANANDGIINIIGSATAMPGIYEINMGCDATPANQAVKYQVKRFTTIGTTNGVSPVGAITSSALDLGAGTAIASVTTAAQSILTPTYTASSTVLQWAQNQNTAYRWVASGIGRMLKIPSTASNGLSIAPIVVTAAFNAVYDVTFEE